MRSWLHYLPKWYRRLPDKPRSSYLAEAEIEQANKTMTRRWHTVNTVGTKRVHRDIKSKRAAATSMIAKSGEDIGLEKGVLPKPPTGSGSAPKNEPGPQDFFEQDVREKKQLD